MIRKLCLMCLFLLLTAPALAQEDGLNLPTELYVLTNGGLVQQYGLGTAGLSVVTPDDAFVLDFGIAPDGNWMAYRTEAGLNLLNIYNPEDNLQIEGTAAGIPPVRGQGDTIAWSPTGDVIAYTTPYGARLYFTGEKTFIDLREGEFSQLMWSPNGGFLAAQADQNIWWIYRREGTNLVLHSAIPSAIGLTWVGGAQVVFAPGDGGLIRMDLAAANAQTVLLDNTWLYELPFLLKDGTLAVFGRQKTDDSTPEGSGRLLGLPPDAPQVQNLSDIPVDLNGLRWAPGGQLMIAFRGGVMAAVIPASGQGLALPVSDAVAYSWGPPPLEQVTSVELPANGYFTAPGQDGFRQVWRLPSDGSSPEILTAAETDVTAFAVSPNERNLAYKSGGSVWLQSFNGGAASSLVEVGDSEVRDITFSPDGTRIAFTTLSTADNPQGGVWVVSATGGDDQLVLANGPDRSTYAPPFYRQPQFAPNVNGLLVVQGGSETTNYQLLDLSSDAALAVGAFDNAIWLPDGRVLGYGNGIGIGDPPPEQKIVAVNPADSTRVELASLPLPVQILSVTGIAPGRARLVLTNYTVGPSGLNVVDLDTNSGAITPGANGGFMVSPVLSPDGTMLAGQTRPGGALTFRDLTTGRQVLLLDPPEAGDFRWGS